jgi:hypothetical protein
MGEVLTPEMLTLTSIVSVKIQSCVTRYEDEDRKKKKCVLASCAQAPKRPSTRATGAWATSIFAFAIALWGRSSRRRRCRLPASTAAAGAAGGGGTAASAPCSLPSSPR